MGRTKPAKKRSEKSKPIINGSSKTPTPSESALFEKAQSLVDQCDYELAGKFLKRIIEQNSSHYPARELLGVVSLELGDIETAQDVSAII
jgi:hypothetical protein